MHFNTPKYNKLSYKLVSILKLSHLVDRHLSRGGEGHRLHVGVHSAVLWQSVSQIQ